MKSPIKTSMKEIRERILDEMVEERANHLIHESVGGMKKNTLYLTGRELNKMVGELVEEQKKGAESHLSVQKKTKSNSDLKDVNSKMKQYVAAGSEMPYDPDQEFFPISNGKMKKNKVKAYRNDPESERFIDDYNGGGMENLMYDIEPDEEWMRMNIEGSPLTGNSPEYANADKTEVNKKFNDKRKRNVFGKQKRKSYNRVPQPVTVVKEENQLLGRILSELSKLR